MRESAEDLVTLQTLLDRSIASAGPFLRRSFQIPECSISAEQVIACLDRVQVISFATVTRASQPPVAPIGALFRRGHFHIPTVMETVRTRHIQQRPAISLTWYDGIDRAMIVHGAALALGVSHPDFLELDTLHHEPTGASVTTWGEVAYPRVDAEVFFTFMRGE